jgi:hypothetical protein
MSRSRARYGQSRPLVCPVASTALAGVAGLTGERCRRCGGVGLGSGVLAHPYGMTAMRMRKWVKTDAKDSYGLANLLRPGSLPHVLGTSVEMISNVLNNSGIPTDQRGLIARKRVGANAVDLNAFRFL